MGIFTKAAAVVESCITHSQLDVALNYVNKAGNKDRINFEEWDLLFYLAQKISFKITSGGLK